MRVIKVHVIFIKGGSRIIYFTNKQYYTLWTRTKAVNFGQSRCGVAACRPTSLVAAQPQDRPRNNRDISGLWERGSHIWNRVPEWQVCCRRQADQGSSLQCPGEKLPFTGGSDIKWAHWFPGKCPSQPLWLTIITKADASLNRLACEAVLAKGLEESPAGAWASTVLWVGQRRGRDPAGHVQRRAILSVLTIQQVRLIILSRHLGHRFNKIQRSGWDQKENE